ncbi:MAG: ComEC/Rec2 family competence protein [Flavobacteriaceae bacterium]
MTSCLILGIVVGFYFDIVPEIPFYAILALTPLLYWAYRKQARDGFPYFELTFICTAILLGVFSVGITNSKNFPQHYSKQNFTAQKMWQLKVSEVLKPTQFAQRYVVNVISLERKQSTGRLLLNFPMDSAAKKIKVDDEFFVFAKLEAIKPPLNPHQFDYRAYLKKLGIYHQIRSNSKEILFTKNQSTTGYGLASNFREYLISKLESKNFGKDELAVLQALLLGQRNAISENTYDNYKNAGAVHILAVSGLHVGILLLLLQFLLTPLEQLPKGKTLKLLVIILLLWGYAFIAGLSPSIVRAVTMFSFLAYALYLNRPTNTFNIIALSMLFTLLIKPLFLFQVGFQMSYAAVFSIVWIYPKLLQFWFPKNYLIRKTWELLAVSTAAQLGILPLSLFYFHQFPALFFVSNLLIIPFLGFILGMGILVLFLALFDSLPDFLVRIYNLTIKVMNALVDWVARQEGFIIKDISFNAPQMILTYAIITALVVFLYKPRLKNTIALLTGILLLQGWSLWTEIKTQKKEAFMLLHKSMHSILLHQTGNSLKLHTSDANHTDYLIKNYTIAEGIDSIVRRELKNSYKFNGKNLFILDSSGIYPKMENPDYLMLIQSPKVNLERVLDALQPKQVIVDGSNYKSYISRWRATCAKKQIPFHSTGEKGFYSFEFILR